MTTRRKVPGADHRPSVLSAMLALCMLLSAVVAADEHPTVPDVDASASEPVPALEASTAGLAVDGAVDDATPIPGASASPTVGESPSETAAELVIDDATTVSPFTPGLDVSRQPRLGLYCIPPESDASAFGWTRDRLFGFVCTTGRWLDSGFGDESFDASEKKIRGYLSLTVERREGEGFKAKPRFRVRVALPNLNRRLSLSVERDNPLETVSGQSDDRDRILEAPVGARDDATTISFGYEARRAIDRLLDFKLGIRAVQGKPNPYLRSRYRRDYGKTEVKVWHFSQILFYRHLEGFGETTTLSYDRLLSDPWLFQWSNIATVSQITEGLAWDTAAHLTHQIDAYRSIRATLAWSGQTAAEVPLSNYGYRLSYRQALGKRPWLIGELYSGHDFKRTEAVLPREIEFFVGAALEVHYGSL